MNLDQYAHERDLQEKVLRSVAPADLSNDFQQDVIERWHDYIAPVKAAQYGTECWERLGPKALIVDINACYYRYRTLLGQERTSENDKAMKNALVDAFGYATMLCIIVHKYPTPEVFEDADPNELADILIKDFWEHNSTYWQRGCNLAMRLAYNMWRTVR